jgi:hypothetical protein
MSCFLFGLRFMNFSEYSDFFFFRVLLRVCLLSKGQKDCSDLHSVGTWRPAAHCSRKIEKERERAPLHSLCNLELSSCLTLANSAED